MRGKGHYRPVVALTEAQRELAAQWWPLACKRAYRDAAKESRASGIRPAGLVDDALSVAGERLCIAAQDYDPARGTPCQLIPVAVDRGLRHARRMRLKGRSRLPMSRLPARLAALPRTFTADDQQELAAAIEQLGERQQEVILLRYFSPSPWTPSAIAALWGVSRERVRQIEAQALLRLRQTLEAA